MIEKYLETDYGKIYYYLKGEGKPLVFLHGWGQSSETFSKIISIFEDNFLILGIDLPGFGKSDEPKYPLTLEDYVQAVCQIIGKAKITDPVIIGHSFGGRIAIRLANKMPLAALILVSSAGIRKFDIKRLFKIYAYKIKKNFYRIFDDEKYQQLIKTSGSRDYRNASPVMKRTLSKIISQDLRKDLKKITARTYLLWGIHDQETPFQDAILMETLLQDAVLIPFYESGHFCYLDEERKFIKTIQKILFEDNLWKQSKT